MLLVGSIAASFVDRLGAPTLLLFMGLGIFLGEDGPGGISFDDATLARDAGTVALMIILIEGGLLAERSDVQQALARPACWPRSRGRLRDLQDALDHVETLPSAPHSGIHAPHSG